LSQTATLAVWGPWYWPCGVRVISVTLCRRVPTQVAKHVVQNAPFILVVPLLCCLVVLMSNVFAVIAAAGDTHKALLFARHQNVELADAINLVFQHDEDAIAEQRLLVEGITLELQGRLDEGVKQVRRGTAARAR
jgi:hypothetical protein